MKWIKKSYLQSIPLRFGVCLSFHCFLALLRNHCYSAILSLRNNGGLLVVYWWMDRLTPPLPMKLMKSLLQRASMDKMTRIRSPWMLADRKGSGRGQWTRSFSFIKIWLVHFQVFSILFQNNFRYLVSHILRFWGILVSLGQNSGYIGILLPPWPGLIYAYFTFSCFLSV